MHVKKETLELYPGEYCIRDYNLDNYYLVVGEDRACLIDTGSGIGDPRVEVRELTEKEPFVLLTHGHLDHANNAWHFDEVYMNPTDQTWLDKHFGKPEYVIWYIDSRGPVRYPDGDLEALRAMVPETMPATLDYQPLQEGDTFDLGGKVLETIEIPGHTPGSVGFLCSDSGYLYAGDALNEGIIIPNESKDRGATRGEIQEMRDALQKLTGWYDKITKVCMGHDGPFKDKSIIRDYLDLCNGLLDGTLEGQYEEDAIRAGYVVRQGLAEFWYEAHR